MSCTSRWIPGPERSEGRRDDDAGRDEGRRVVPTIPRDAELTEWAAVPAASAGFADSVTAAYIHETST